MGLNIVAERKMSLKGFAEGWDSCFLRIRAINEEQRVGIAELLDEFDGSKIENIEKLREAAKEVVLGGTVRSTDEDGKQRNVSFAAADTEDLEVVVRALNVTWLQEVLLTAAGLTQATTPR